MVNSPVQSRQFRNLLRSPAFRVFWLANLVSNLGTGAFILALNWLTVKQHGAPGIAALALGYGLPQFALALFGGTVSDRVDRRNLFVITETSFLVVAVVLLHASLRGLVPLWLLVLVNVLYGAISAFDTPARTALISQMVKPEEVVVAQQLYSISGGVTNVLGPALGGILLSMGSGDRSHEEFAFLFNALSFLPILLSVPLLPITQLAGNSNWSMGFVASVREGLSYVRGRSALRSLLLLLAVVMLLGMPYQTLLPIFVRSHLTLEMGHGFYAALLSAVGLGALCGSVFGLSGSQPKPGLVLLWVSLGMGTAILLLIGSSVIHWASLAAFFAGACGSVTITLGNAMIQGLTPAAMRGRIAAISNLTRGLQAFSTAVASFIILRVGYFDVQLTLALSLIIGVLILGPSLIRVTAAPKITT